MIRNEADLAVVQSQLALVEHALAELRREVTNPRNFEVYSEGYVDMIAELKAEIDAYRAAQPANGQTPADSKLRDTASVPAPQG